MEKHTLSEVFSNKIIAELFMYLITDCVKLEDIVGIIVSKSFEFFGYRMRYSRHLLRLGIPLPSHRFILSFIQRYLPGARAFNNVSLKLLKTHESGIRIYSSSN